MSAPRTYKIQAPHMRGEDVGAWQREIKHEFSRMNINCPIVADGDYGVATRAFTASLCHALGMIASDVMKEGVTPELRTRIRNRRLTVYERTRMAARVGWRRRLRARYAGDSGGGVAKPVGKIIEDSWGYHPGVHDGIDVICPEDAPIYAMVRSKVVRISDEWWGLGAPANQSLKDKGDGVIIVEILETIGPFRRGQRIVYGHAEKPRVKVGQEVRAGQQIGHAGLANAWHIHLCLNGGHTTKGIGDRDPRAILNYAKKHG